MHRRRLLHTSLALAGVGLLTACGSQRRTTGTPEHIHRIGWLSPNQASFWLNSAQAEAVRQGLRELGYHEGRNLHIEYRFAEDQLERLPALAAELVQQDVALILVGGPVALQALRQATNTIPLVMAFYNGDPVRDGVIASFARPGGTITGVTLRAQQVAGKRLELLKTAVPSVARVAVLSLPTPTEQGQLTELQAAAPALGVEIQTLAVAEVSALPSVLASTLGEPPDALFVTDNSVWVPHFRSIADFAMLHRLPAMSNAIPGGSGLLLGYGPDVLDLLRRTAGYVDKILRGTQPGELPMEDAQKFDFVVNLTVARSLGLTIPSAVLSQATHVIG
jgi:putative ABC transport system substrate-binding protein